MFAQVANPVFTRVASPRPRRLTRSHIRLAMRVAVVAALCALVLVGVVIPPMHVAAATGPLNTTIDPGGAVCKTYINPDASKVQTLVVHAPGVRYATQSFTYAKWTAYVQYRPLTGGTWYNLPNGGRSQTQPINWYWKSVYFESMTISMTSSNLFEFRVLNQIQYLNNGTPVATSDWLGSSSYATYQLAFTTASSQTNGTCQFP
jgi:hypothetical protein